MRIAIVNDLTMAVKILARAVAKGQEDHRMRGLEAGASCYLTKSSFQEETLIHAVRDLIGEAELA